MKKIVLVFITIVTTTVAMAQQAPVQQAPAKKNDYSKIKIDRAGDHVMLTLTSDQWSDMPDSIHNNRKGGFSRGINFAIMFDKRFKSDPYWSIAFGLGLSNSNIFFQNMGTAPSGVGVASVGNQTLTFTPTTGQHFKKYKLATTYLEVPVELRYTFNPANENKSWKVAFGAKFGLLLNAHTKGKTLEAYNNAPLNNYTEKESSTRYFNTGRVAATFRVGYGHFSLFGSYSITQLLRYGNIGIRPYQIGITLSGL
jgi:hypothetical protein